MRILYGVVGEGMGHATRSRVLIEHLARAGHEIRIVVSGRAHRFLVERLKPYSNITLHEIHGLTLRYFDNKLDRSDSLFQNLRNAPKGIAKNVKVYRKVAEDGFKADLVVSDFESWAALYALNHRVPVVSVDNMQVINRCRHDKVIRKDPKLNFRLTKLAVKAKMPGAYHYLVTSFFFPEIRKKRTTLVPPILRPEILDAKREPGKHVLVYQTAQGNEGLIQTLKQLPFQFRVYGLGREGSEGNIELRPFSETAFVDDLRTARVVIAGGGYSLMSESVTLHVPMLSVPIVGQAEQELNALYLDHLGYGRFSRTLDPEVLLDFLEHIDDHSTALENYERKDNSTVLACLDELIERRTAGEKRPVALNAAAR